MKTTKYVLVYLMPFFMGLSVACFKSCQQAPSLAKVEKAEVTKAIVRVQTAVR